MYQNGFMGGPSPLPHPDMHQNGSGMQQFGQINSYAYGHLGMQPMMSMPPHGIAPPPPAQYYNPPPPPHPGFIPNHGNTYPMNHPYFDHSVIAPHLTQPQFHGPVVEVRDETTSTSV